MSWQLGNIISTAIFVPIGISTFSNFFVSSNPSSITFIVMLVLGLIFDTSWTTILLVITLNKKLQRFSLKALIANESYDFTKGKISIIAINA
ncbi:hypothetical protein, partial [Mycoplasmopsis bovis]|uniref:hypothetical protein n=1 Tax=Mycoplasmopsis bovis TaxID=28903 RepID=UPI003D2AAF1D